MILTPKQAFKIPPHDSHLISFVLVESSCKCVNGELNRIKFSLYKRKAMDAKGIQICKI